MTPTTFWNTVEMSLPLWECGLKSCISTVTLYQRHVTPLVGVWIEIEEQDAIDRETKSLPLWECGLK